MERDHAIRVLVAGLKGPARDAAIMRYLKDPALRRKELRLRLALFVKGKS